MYKKECLNENYILAIDVEGSEKTNLINVIPMSRLHPNMFNSFIIN
jgi:hypothetical protein